MATKIKRLWVKTSAITGKLDAFAGRQASADPLLVVVENKGLVYYLAPKNHYDSDYMANERDSWHVVGDPHESRRARSQKARGVAGKLAPWEEKALDAKLLDVLREYRNGSGPEYLYEDLFNNHSWTWTRGDAERFGGDAEGNLSQLAEKATYWKPTQRSLVKSALARLKKRKLVTDVWNSRAGKEYVMAVEFGK